LRFTSLVAEGQVRTILGGSDPKGKGLWSQSSSRQNQGTGGHQEIKSMNFGQELSFQTCRDKIGRRKEKGRKGEWMVYVGQRALGVTQTRPSEL